MGPSYLSTASHITSLGCPQAIWMVSCFSWSTPQVNPSLPPLRSQVLCLGLFNFYLLQFYVQVLLWHHFHTPSLRRSIRLSSATPRLPFHITCHSKTVSLKSITVILYTCCIAFLSEQKSLLEKKKSNFTCNGFLHITDIQQMLLSRTMKLFKEL